MPALNAIRTVITDGLHTASFVLYAANNETLGDITAAMAVLLEDIDANIKGQIKRSKMTVNFPVPGTVKDAPESTADVEELAELKFTSLGGQEYNMNLPTWDEGKNVAGTDNVDTADGDVAALITSIEDGIDTVPLGGTSTVNFRTYGDEESDLLYPIGFTSATEKFKKQRK